MLQREGFVMFDDNLACDLITGDSRRPRLMKIPGKRESIRSGMFTGTINVMH